MSINPTTLASTDGTALWSQLIGELAIDCLHLEVNTYPKPGLVSHVDAGAHSDMNAHLLHRSANVLTPCFAELCAAGADGAGMNRLRSIGIAAEKTMLAATRGVNTHRGAIFGLGLLVAAAGFRQKNLLSMSLGEVVIDQWQDGICNGPAVADSHGSQAMRKYGMGGARQEAAMGFPSVYKLAVPALIEGTVLSHGDDEAARVHACMALIAGVDDTNLLHRGGVDGLVFARTRATAFLQSGGVGQRDWRTRAMHIHAEFVERRLSPGGCADLLAMALFVHSMRLLEARP